MDRVTEVGEGAHVYAQVAAVEHREGAGNAVAVPAEAGGPEASAVVPQARELGGERALAMLLRAGGILGGVCFLASLPLQWLPDTERIHVAIDLLQKAGASFLLVTPVARLGVAGVLLGMKGEYRYLAYAVVSAGLLAVAVGAGYAA